MLAPYTIPYAGMIRIRFPGAFLLWAGSSRQGLRAALARTVSQPLVGAPLGAGTLWRGKEESKRFFFEKKNQKTFIRAVAVLCVTARPNVFWLFLETERLPCFFGCSLQHV